MSDQNPFQTLIAAVAAFPSFAHHSLQNALSRLSPPLPAWARVTAASARRPGAARTMAAEEMEDRLSGVPVYALSNGAEEFVLVSATRTGRRLGLFCFREEDAAALLDQVVKDMDEDLRGGSKVVPVALNKVLQLKVDGVALRFVPDSHEIVNAIKVLEKRGEPAEGFSGVPVFQCRSLILSSENKRYRPVFFRKEDLDRSLERASRDQGQLNPVLRPGEISVCEFEEIIKDLKEPSSSKWNDIVFIPPGFDVAAATRQ